jgi:hypothetical protein
MSRNPKALAGKSAAVRSAAFLRWFSASKVQDARGDPLEVFHGTTRDFSVFRASDVGAFGAGIYFGGSEDANHYAAAGMLGAAESDDLLAQVMPVYLSLQNPLIVEVPLGVAPARALLEALPDIGVAAAFEADAAYEEFDGKLTEQLKAMGFDGVLVNFPDGSEYVAFEASQVKSVFNVHPAQGPDMMMSVARRADGRRY